MKKLVRIVLLLIVIGGVAGAAYWYFTRPETTESQMVETVNTNKVEDAGTLSEADPLMVGRWESAIKPKWFKIYYDDPCDEPGYFWGKEWDETDDVFEEDLIYHGNGWFKWRKQRKILTEIYSSDGDFFQAPVAYCIDSLGNGVLFYHNQAEGKSDFQSISFSRIGDW